MSDTVGNGELPQGWEWTTVGEVASVVRGVTYKKTDSAGGEGAGLVPLLRATNIGEVLSFEDCVFIPDRLVKEEQFVRAGDIVVATSSGSSKVVGKSALVERPWKGTFGAFCAVIRPGDRIVDRYLAWFMASNNFRERASRLAAGSNINNLKREHITEAPLPLPSREEQERIVGVIESTLSELDRANSELDQARAKLHLLQSVIFEKTVATGTEQPVGELLDGIEAGKSFQCHGHPAGDDEWGVIKVSAMTWGHFDEEENKAVLPGTEVDPRWEVKLGDLLLSRANTNAYVGASVLVERCRPRLLLSDKSLRLLIREEIESKWLHFALSAPSTRRKMSAVATGTKDSMRNISQAKLKSISIRVPSPDAQRKLVAEIETKLSVLRTTGTEIDRQISRSLLLRQQLLNAAMRGDYSAQTPIEIAA